MAITAICNQVEKICYEGCVRYNNRCARGIIVCAVMFAPGIGTGYAAYSLLGKTTLGFVAGVGSGLFVANKIGQFVTVLFLRQAALNNDGP